MKYYLFSIFILQNLLSVAQEPRLVIPVGHSQIVRSVEFSPDGTRLLSGSYDSTIRLWDALTGAELIELNKQTIGLFSPHFSKDGSKILTGRGDNTAMIWDAATGKELIVFKGHEAKITSLGYSPDSKKVITASDDGVIKTWDASTGRLLLTLKAHKYEINEARFSPDGKLIVSVSSDHTAKLWDAKTGNLLHVFSDYTDRVTFARFSGDGQKLLTSSWDYTVKVWEVKTGKLLLNLNRFKSEIRSAEFSPDNKIIATGCYDKTVETWDATTGELLQNFEGHTDAVWQVKFSKDGQLLLTAGNGNNARLWQTATGKLFQHYNVGSMNVNSAIFSPDDSKVALALYENKAMVLNRTTGETLLDLKGHSEKISFSIISPDHEKLVTGAENTAKVWNIKTGKLLYTVNGHNGSLNTAVFSPDGKQLVTASNDYTAKIIDAASGRLITTLNGHTSGISLIQFSADGKKIATASYDLSTRVWNAATGDSLGTYYHRDYINSIDFSPDGNYMLTTSGDLSLENSQIHYAVLWDIVNVKYLKLFDSNQGAVMAGGFSPDGSRVFTVSKNGATTVWETETGKALFELPIKSSTNFSASFSPDGNRVIVAYNHKSSVVFDMSQRKMRVEQKGYNRTLFPIAYAPDGKTIAIADYLGQLSLFNALNGDLIAQTGMPLTNSELTAANTALIWEYHSGKKQVVTLPAGSDYWFILWGENRLGVSDESKFSLFNTLTGKKNSDLIAIDSSDYMVHLPTREYSSTPGATKLLSYVTTGLKVITFEQLDVKYNRPDVVLNALGNQDTSLVKAYRKAYVKRVKRLGFDASTFSNNLNVPEAEFTNRKAISFNQTSEKLVVKIHAQDKASYLAKFNIWVNECPLFGMKGLSLVKSKRKYFDTSITINLSSGINIIETSVTNSTGIESFRAPLKLNYTPVIVPKQVLYFIGIGIDRFNQPGHNLNYSVKDVCDLSLKLKERFNSDINIDTLFNESVTVSNIAALKKKLRQTSINDRIIISYSGHGLLSRDYDYFLSTYEVDFTNPSVGGLAYDVLESLLDSIPARQKLMLIDACHSGEVDKEEMQQYRQVLTYNADQGLKGAVVENIDSSKIGMKNSFELMQELFVNVGRATGATIISAAAGTQLAQERGDLKNGVFTFSILEYLQQHPRATVSELKEYVNKRVPELTNGLQVPTTRTETKSFDWRLW